MIQSIDAYHYFDEEEHDTFAMTDNDADAAGCSRLGCAREGSPPNWRVAQFRGHPRPGGVDFAIQMAVDFAIQMAGKGPKLIIYDCMILYVPSGNLT